MDTCSECKARVHAGYDMAAHLQWHAGYYEDRDRLMSNIKLLADLTTEGFKDFATEADKELAVLRTAIKVVAESTNTRFALLEFRR